MPPQSDLLIDRKRLKHHLSLWRTLAVMAIFVCIGLYAGHGLGWDGATPARDYIAEITIEGMMLDDPKRDAMMRELRDDKHAKAVIVRLDSPGGTTVAGEEIYLNLRDIAQKKPVIGVMHTLCASACYMASLGTDRVFARKGTLTGSIGVLIESVEITRLAEKLGITPISIKSGAYKDVPSLTSNFTGEQRKVVGELVTDAYNQFISLIVERRKMNEAQVHKLADGRVYTGRQAKDLDLVDAIGGNKEALLWLAKTHKINPQLEIRQIKPEAEYSSLLEQLTQYTGIKLFNRSAIGLDGLVSIWHPSAI